MRSAIFIEPNGILATMGGIGLNSPGNFYDLQMEARSPLLTLKRAGFLLIAVANESDWLRTGVSRAEFDRMHDLVQSVFALDDFLVCRHEDGDRCPCRKPRAGLLTEAAFKWRVGLDRSFVIGNRWQDAELARLAGCVSLLLRSPRIGQGHHDYVLSDLPSITKKILELKEFSPGAAPFQLIARMLAHSGQEIPVRGHVATVDQSLCVGAI